MQVHPILFFDFVGIKSEKMKAEKVKAKVKAKR